MNEDDELEGPPENMSKDDAAGHQRVQVLATVIGFNELAKMHADDLGQRLYYRMARDSWLETLVKLGATSPMKPDEDRVILELPDIKPCIRFRARDIELMRITVAKWDIERVTNPRPASPERP